MKCRQCVYWLRDFSLPEGIGYCSAKGGIYSENDVCEIFRRKELPEIAVKVYYY